MTKLEEVLNEKYPYDLAPVDISYGYGINDVQKLKREAFTECAKWLIAEAEKFKFNGCGPSTISRENYNQGIIDAQQEFFKYMKRLIEG